MSTASFSVSYCGPALDAGKMDVRELAPALLAFGGLVEEANRVLNGKSVTVSVKVTRFEDGSFGISFEIIQAFTDQLVGLFSGQTATAAANLITFLGFTGAIGLWQLIKRVKGKKPLRAKRLENGNVEIDFGNESVEVDGKVLDLYRDFRVRKEAENVVKPLEREGIDQLQVKQKNKNIDTVEKNEAVFFRAPEAEDHIIDERETVATFSIHSLSFKEDNKWRLTDGSNTFFVTIKDQDFLRRVNEDLISFSKGDRLKMRLFVRTWESGEGIKTEYEAMEILDHKNAVRQLALSIEGDTGDKNQ